MPILLPFLSISPPPYPPAHICPDSAPAPGSHSPTRRRSSCIPSTPLQTRSSLTSGSLVLPSRRGYRIPPTPQRSRPTLASWISSTGAYPPLLGPNYTRSAEACPCSSAPAIRSRVSHRGSRLERNMHVEEETGSHHWHRRLGRCQNGPVWHIAGGTGRDNWRRGAADWHWHPRHEDFRAQFWCAFYAKAGDISYQDREAIEIARLLGLFLVYGFDLLAAASGRERRGRKTRPDAYSCASRPLSCAAGLGREV